MNDDQIDAYVKDRLTAAKAEVPGWIRLRTEQTLSELRRKRSRRRAIGYVAAALFAVAGVGGAGWAHPGLAEAFRSLPLVNSIFQHAGDLTTRQASERGQTSKVNVSADHKGIRLTIREVLYDGGRLSFGYSLEAGGDLLPVRPTLLVNGRKMHYRLLDVRSETLDGSVIGVMDLLPEKPFPDSFRLTIKYDTMIDQAGGVEGLPLKLVKGNWTFRLPVTKTATAERQFEINGAEAAEGERRLVVNHVSLTSEETVIDFETWGSWPVANGLIQPFEVLDDSGVPLQIWGTGRGTDGPDPAKLKHRLTLMPLGEIPPFLILRSYAGDAWSPSGQAGTHVQRHDASKLPVTLSQGKAGSVTVAWTEFAKDKTTVYYYVHGEHPFAQAWEFWLENDAGAVQRGSPVLIDRRKLLFAMDFSPLGERVSYVAREVAVPAADPALEVKIPLR